MRFFLNVTFAAAFAVALFAAGCADQTSQPEEEQEQPQQQPEQQQPEQQQPEQQQPAEPQTPQPEADPEGQPQPEEQAPDEQAPDEPAPDEPAPDEPAPDEPAAAAAGQGGSVAGTITFEGTPPEEKKLPLDPACAKLHSDTPTTRFYVVGSEGGLADVFVHVIEGVPDKDYPVPEEPAVIDQDGCEYTPYILGAQTGQTIVVKNSDPVLHNVHPTPEVSDNKEYNKAQLPMGPDLEFSWDKPETFLRFKCDIHPWMFAYVGLVDHPFYSVSSEDGSFNIEDLPPGDYVIEARHRKAGTKTKEVTVKAGETLTADFTFQASEGQ